MTEEEEDEYGDTYFMGDCTCDHDRYSHGWGRCGNDDCKCEAGWEE